MTTTAPIIEIVLAGTPVKLCYTFRAFRELGVNPMKPSTVAEFFGSLDTESAAKWVAAGVSGYNALAKQLGEDPQQRQWSVDDALDVLDMKAFQQIITAAQAAMVPEEATEEKPKDENPLVEMASVGENSGPSPDSI